MPRVHIQLQDIDVLDDWEAQDDWDELVGTRPADERREAQFGSMEMRNARRNATGSREARDQRRSERRKTVRRGGKR
jgi:hypothetical protein